MHIACAARVTVLGLCVCLSICLCQGRRQGLRKGGGKARAKRFYRKLHPLIQVRMRWKPPTTIFARLATSLGWCSYLAPAVHECSVISQDYRTSITKVFMTLFLKKGGAIAPLAPPWLRHCLLPLFSHHAQLDILKEVLAATARYAQDS